MAQTTYEPLVNSEGTVFCKNYDHTTEYHKGMGQRPLYTKEVVKWFFDNEVRNIERFSNKPYAPEVLDIDYTNQKIFIKWYKVSCNEIVYGQPEWPIEWLDMLKDIMVDQYKEGYYKLTMYSHCHYITDTGTMKAIDWYGCVPADKPLVPVSCMDAIIHDTAKFRLEETGPAADNFYNMETMFKRGLQEHVFWGDKNLKFIYDIIFPS
jgi:hypothetical protein